MLTYQGLYYLPNKTMGTEESNLYTIWHGIKKSDEENTTCVMAKALTYIS
jgi:hypothetical protein